jgi:glyoxylase-like metal-dependent hydrolase (beta-lactamase superfamily II)
LAGDHADIPFDRSLEAGSNTMQSVSPLVRRLIANNGGPFTFTGTCTYVVGRGEVTIIDPGPNEPRHLETLLAAIAGERVARIMVTHTHRDHSPGAAALRAATGAPIVGCAPYDPSPPLPGTDLRPSDASNDLAYRPDTILADGEGIAGPGYTLIAVATPGHAANHLAFALPEDAALFSGDHVMAWSTTVVAPPDGSMRAYMASLDKLQGRDDAIYWPGHGGPVRNPQRFVKALAQHRRHREGAILRRLAAGDSGIDTLVTRLYADLAPALRGAAALSVLAHLQDLCERGLVRVEGPLGLKARFTPA